MSKHAVVEGVPTSKKVGRRLRIGAGIFGGMMAIGTGVAVAAWLVTGSGTGSVSTQAINPFVISVSGVGGLYPGASTSGNVRVWNQNGFPIALNSATISSDSPCYTATIQDPTGQTVGVPNFGFGIGDSRRGGSVDLTYTVSMPATVDSTCANATFTPTVTVNGQVGA